MFYIALCDDERKDLDILTEHLKDLPWNKYKYEAIPLQNGEDLVEMYRNGRRFHLVILDMMMKPMSGIKTAVNIRRYDADVPIIIVTSTPEYALEGYKVSASRYILKPVDKSSFLQEVQRILDRSYKGKSPFYSFTCDSGVIKLPLDDICYFESDMRTITLHTKEKDYYFTGKIKEIAHELAGRDFVRVHKSYVVNLGSVHRIFKGDITMTDGRIVPMSKNRGKEIHLLLLQYLEKSL